MFGGKPRLFAAIAAGATLSMNGRIVLSPLLPTVIEDVGITSFEAGLALSIMWALTALSQYPGGRLSDQLTRETGLVAGLGLLFAGFVTLLFTVEYLQFVLGAALVGLGTGLYNPSAYATVADLAVDERGIAFGVLSASMDLGAALASPLAVVVLAVAVWQAAFVPVLAAVAVVVAVVHRSRATPYEAGVPSLDVRETIARLFGRSRIRRTLLATALGAFVWQGVASFLPTYLQVERGIPSGFANGLFTGLFVVGMFARPVSGWLGDRLGYATVSAVAPLATATGLVLIVLAPSRAALVVGVAAFGGGISGFFPVALTYLMNSFPDASMGGDFGATRTVFVGLGSAGPAFVGFTAERADYATGFVVLVGCLVVSALLMYSVRR